MALRCVSKYKTQRVSYEPGQVVEGLTAAEEAHLLADSPGSFERVEAEAPPEPTKALDEPPVHRAILEPQEKKGARRGKQA